MRKLKEWHKNYYYGLLEKWNVSSYQIAWLSWFKGIIFGIIIMLLVSCGTYQLTPVDKCCETDVVYLEDSQFTIESSEFSRPIKFWGSPWQPEFYNWAFNLPRLGDELKKYWDMIPDDTDVLITHGPPNEARDFVSNWRQGDVNVGCELLRFRVEQFKPLLHVFGHIHGAYGSAYIKDVLYVNASICNDRYIPSNKPIVVDLTEVDGKIIATYVEV